MPTSNLEQRSKFTKQEGTPFPTQWKKLTYSSYHPRCHNFEIFLTSSELLTVPYLIFWCLLEICDLFLRCRISSWTSISKYIKTGSVPTYFWAGYVFTAFPGPWKVPFSYKHRHALLCAHTWVHTQKECTSFWLYPLYWTKSPFTTFRFSLRLWRTRLDKPILPSFLASLNLHAINDHTVLQIYCTYMNIYFHRLICLGEILKSSAKDILCDVYNFGHSLTWTYTR